MPVWLTVVITVFDLIIAAAAVWGIGKKVEKKLLDNHDEQKQRDADIQEALNGVRMYPTYRQQSQQIQAELQANDAKLLATCESIQKGVEKNQQILNERLDRLEHREMNALREKIIDLYRKFTSPTKNPMLAWSEMEHHSFFNLVGDYEDLGGNDYVHHTIIPAMNELDVIPMHDEKALKALYDSRNA